MTPADILTHDGLRRQTPTRFVEYVRLDHLEQDRRNELLEAMRIGDLDTVRDIYAWSVGLEQKFAYLTTLAGDYLNALEQTEGRR